MLLVLKKYLPLQCFNKQRLFYSFKKAKKMKKITMFMATAAIAFAFAACTENKPAEATTVEEAAPTVEEVADSAAAAVEEVADSAAAAVEEVADSAAAAVEEAAK
jgi:hypothetical protein